MRRATIEVLKHGKQFDARVCGLTATVTNADSEAEAIGRLVLLLSHPLRVKILRETTDEE